MPSALYEEARNSDIATAVWTVHVRFPAFEALSEKNFYWATADGIELEDGNVYRRALKEYPKGRHQTDRGNDYAEFLISNPDNTLYQEILPYEDLIERCEVEIREAYEVEPDYYHSEIKFKGNLRTFTINDEDHTLALTAISDISRPGFLVGNRILTRERCGTQFNVNGLLSPLTNPCGWQTGQGGNPDFCSLLLEGVDGCKAHNNSHRYYAVPALSTATVEVIQGDDTGFPSHTGQCFSEKTFVLMADWSIVPIHKVNTEHKTMGFDVFNFDILTPADVLHTTKTMVEGIEYVRFDTGTEFEVIKDHLFYLGGRLFAPVGSLGTRPTLGMDFQRRKAVSRLMSKSHSDEMLFVYNLRTSSNNYIVTDEDAMFYYFVHNRKFDP